MFEIIGLPGSGKSFLIKNFDNKKVDIFDEERFYHLCENIKLFDKIIGSLYTALVYLDVFVLLFIYCIFFTKNKFKCLKQVIDIFKYTVLLNIILKGTKGSSVFDQAIVQYLWSLCLFDDVGMKYSKLLNYVYKKFIRKFNIIVCYYLVDYKLAAERAVSREKKCFTDYYELNDLIELYNKHALDYNIIKKYCLTNFYIISNVEDLNNLVNRLG